MRRLLAVTLVSVIPALNGGCHPGEPNGNGQLQGIDKNPFGILKVNGTTVVALSYDGKKAVTWNYAARGGGDDLRLWDVDERKSIRSMQLRPDHLGYLTKVRFSPDGEKLLAVDTSVRVFDLASGKLLRRIPLRSELSGGGDAAWTPDGKHILAGPDLRLWSLETGKDALNFNTGAAEAGLSGDGRIAYSRDNQIIRLWKTANGEKIGEFDFGDWSVTGRVQFALNDRSMTVVWGHHPGVAVWELSTGKRIREVRFDAQGKRIAKDADADRPLELFGKISSFDFALNGKRALLAVEKVRRTANDAGRGRTWYSFETLEAKVVLWDAERDKVLHTFPRGAEDANLPVFLSGDGLVALIGTSAGYQIWKLPP